MGGEVLVALLVTGVLGNEVEVFAADDDRPVHLGRHDGAGEDTAADRDLAGEGALLVCEVRVLEHVPGVPHLPDSAPAAFRVPCRSCRLGELIVRVFGVSLLRRRGSRGFARTDVLALNGGGRGAETQTDVLVPSPATLARAGGLDLGLAVEEDWRLLALVVPWSSQSVGGSVSRARLTVRLLLESALALHGKFGGHLVGDVVRRCACRAWVWLSKGQSSRAGILLVGE